VGEAIARIENATGDCNLRTRLLPAVSSDVVRGRREAIVARSWALYAVRGSRLSSSRSRRDLARKTSWREWVNGREEFVTLASARASQSPENTGEIY
jgi:hypothetical protein